MSPDLFLSRFLLILLKYTVSGLCSPGGIPDMIKLCVQNRVNANSFRDQLMLSACLACEEIPLFYSTS